MTESHYDVLGLTHKATHDEIRLAYKDLSKQVHPDKIRTVPGRSRTEEAALRQQAKERWTKIEMAHDVLSDAVLRAMYDIDAGFVPNTPVEHAKIARLKRREAAIAIRTMEETVAANRAEEEAKGGLLILQARYGDLSKTDYDSSSAISAPYIDVSVPLQCMVHDSALILEGGRSRFWLEGFYDPSMGTAAIKNRLYIRYKFLGQLHEAEFGDLEAVGIPLEEHCIEGLEGVNTLAHTSSSMSTRARERQKARRRYLLLGTFVMLGASVYFMRRNGVTVTSAQQAVEGWTRWMKGLIQNRLTSWTGKSTTTTPAVASSSSSSPSSSSSKAQ